ncbi:TsaB protein, required for threonylcarbamoyladenosine (t(6)A) formation in tRNA [Clostridiaceae bacterium JG1575]|nr:TsaB protein, required for threonylcarbamoyladenosine (t(6)A) formation in tRNA [Clostridiaceae bacterium JG1575]
MLILALETSATNCSVALSKDGALLAETTFHAGRRHSEILLPLTEDLFKIAGLAPKDLTQICVNIGPGSFTGIRIGFSVAQAMAYALSIPLYAYSSFEAALWPLRCLCRPVLVLHDALKTSFYSAYYDVSPEGDLKEQLAPAVRDLTQIQELLGSRKDLVVTGDALALYGADLQKILPKATLFQDGIGAKASHLALQCAKDVSCGVAPRENPFPQYMRKPQAEREYEARHAHS